MSWNDHRLRTAIEEDKMNNDDAEAMHPNGGRPKKEHLRDLTEAETYSFGKYMNLMYNTRIQDLSEGEQPRYIKQWRNTEMGKPTAELAKREMEAQGMQPRPDLEMGVPNRLEFEKICAQVNIEQLVFYISAAKAALRQKVESL